MAALRKRLKSPESWEEEELNPLECLLDPFNPRIEVPPDADQNEIRVELLTHEEVSELARQIVRQRGLVAGERIITTVERGRYVVLEGNRRVCAIQLLLNPDLIPKDFVRNFPRIDDDDLRQKIALVKSDVAPDRESAQRSLTLRHSVEAVRKWSPVAKMRRVGRLLDRGFDVAAIADQVDDDASHVRKLLRQYRLLQYAINLKGWEKHEQQQLKDQRLEPSRYLRMLEVAGAPKRLGLSFDEHLNLSTTLPAATFEDNIRKIARATLIKDAKGETLADTRSSITDILGEETPKESKLHGDPVVVAASPTGKFSTKRRPKPGPPKQDRFFETLQCKVKDDPCVRLTREIRQISPVRTPTAAAFLLRAIFAAALEYQTKKANKWDNLISKGKPGWHPDLSEVINFVIQNQEVFANKNLRRAVEVLHSQKAKDYLDLVIHAQYLKIGHAELQTLANKTRGIIEAILRDEA